MNMNMRIEYYVKLDFIEEESSDDMKIRMMSTMYMWKGSVLLFVHPSQGLVEVSRFELELWEPKSQVLAITPHFYKPRTARFKHGNYLNKLSYGETSVKVNPPMQSEVYVSFSISMSCPNILNV